MCLKGELRSSVGSAAWPVRGRRGVAGGAFFLIAPCGFTTRLATSSPAVSAMAACAFLSLPPLSSSSLFYFQISIKPAIYHLLRPPLMRFFCAVEDQDQNKPLSLGGSCQTPRPLSSCSPSDVRHPRGVVLALAVAPVQRREEQGLCPCAASLSLT